MSDSTEARISELQADHNGPSISPHALELMRLRTMAADVGWACYQNQEMGHPHAGDLRYLVIGPARTFTAPPPRYPDHPELGLGWRYLFIGWADLESGNIIRATRPGAMQEEGAPS